MKIRAIYTKNTTQGSEKMKLIVGLGNPGKEFDGTRHNIGFAILDAFATEHGLVFNKKKFDGIYCESTINEERVMLLKPQKYINLSGDVIVSYINYFKISIDDILVVNDDLDLLIGSYKVKSDGGTAGHNGLKSIERSLKTKKYKRLKVGISNNKEMDTRDYVLGKFSNEEKEIICNVIEQTKQIIIDFISIDIIDIMNKYNKNKE